MDQELKFHQLSTKNSSKTWLIGGCPHTAENRRTCTKHDDFQAFKSRNQRNSCVHELSMLKSSWIIKEHDKNSTYSFSQEYGRESYMEKSRGLIHKHSKKQE